VKTSPYQRKQHRLPRGQGGARTAHPAQHALHAVGGCRPVVAGQQALKHRLHRSVARVDHRGDVGLGLLALWRAFALVRHQRLYRPGADGR
jgi:hypothetical protein